MGGDNGMEIRLWLLLLLQQQIILEPGLRLRALTTYRPTFHRQVRHYQKEEECGTLMS